MLTLRVFIGVPGQYHEVHALQSEVVPRVGEVIRAPGNHALEVKSVAYEVGPGSTIQVVEIYGQQVQ